VHYDLLRSLPVRIITRQDCSYQVATSPHFCKFIKFAWAGLGARAGRCHPA